MIREEQKILEKAAKDYTLDNILDFNPELYEYMNRAFKAGVNWQKSHMLKDAVKVTVENWNPNPHPEVTISLNPDEFVSGDKVRIVVLKEKEE